MYIHVITCMYASSLRMRATLWAHNSVVMDHWSVLHTIILHVHFIPVSTCIYMCNNLQMSHFWCILLLMSQVYHQLTDKWMSSCLTGDSYEVVSEVLYGWKCKTHNTHTLWTVFNCWTIGIHDHICTCTLYMYIIYIMYMYMYMYICIIIHSPGFVKAFGTQPNAAAWVAQLVRASV